MGAVGRGYVSCRRLRGRGYWYGGGAHPKKRTSFAMDKDRIKGAVKQAQGAIKEGLGKASNDASLEAEGKIEKASGTAQKAFGKAKDALRKG
jgi:uncharacterized protein YjbJ (UPF0337 family)